MPSRINKGRCLAANLLRIDFEYQDKMNDFSQSLDHEFGIEIRRKIFATNKDYFGGITRMYAYTDSEKMNHCIWTTFYSHYHHDYINIYLKAHEEAHVVQKLKMTDELIKKSRRHIHLSKQKM